MPDFVYDIPLRDLATWFAIAAVGSIIFGMLVVKPIMRLLIGAGPDLNEAINYGTAGFNLFYGLLLGLLTVSAYQNNERIAEAVLQEATVLAAVYSDVNAYPEPTRSDTKAMIRDYVLFTLYKDWPAHARGAYLDGGANRVNAMRQKLSAFEPQTPGQEILHAQMLSAFQEFTRARQLRLNGVYTEIPNVLWYAVLVGAAINIILIVLLRMRPVRQFVLGTITAFFLGVILFVIVALDDPLRGEAAIQPDPLRRLWDRVMIWDEP
ncbi:bestrophin-like domain [Falsirhodobacter xinxiangensis]|uniref:bestrophin-like domain n=1 Tax=Falsirhodobacter xinxiangensis TaxID=2530049 RepID=UPI0010AB2AA9|nr:DUF4239 domain-containing protein [Rhodobacter xinxiangensis]